MPIIASVLMNAFPTPVSSIEQAARTHTRVFIISMVWFVVAAVVSGWLTIALWKASNKESDLRIAQANERAENARNAAAAANERAENLENANLKLRGDVAGVQTRLLTAAGEVASLQKEAADSRAAQQRVEVELNRQRERAALAEKQLLEIREARRPRSFNNQER